MVYFVDDNEELLFANQKLAEWVGVPLEQLKGIRTVYSANTAGVKTDELAAKVQGLCPPPELWGASGCDSTELAKSFWISKPLVNDQANQMEPAAEFCWASAVRVNSPNVISGVLVVADSSTSLTQGPAAKSHRPVRDSAELHTTLALISQEMNQGFTTDSLVGTSAFAERIRRQVDVAGKAETDVLVHGPLGCGKEHLARAIFSIKSQVGSAELAPIHCAIADPPLIQQRIADARRSIDVMQATSQSDDHAPRQVPLVLLLLDAERLSHDAQSELLGFLELPTFQVQTLATSSVRLLDLAAQGSYSNRLAHRLGSLSIEMVALKERVKDIPMLAQSILEKGNVRRRKQISGFAESVLECLVEFEWPENMNQLARTVETAAANCQGRLITESDLPTEFMRALQAMRIGRPVEVSIDLDEYLAAIERELVERALKQTKGNKTQAAKQLNISRPKLLRRLAQLGLDEYLSPLAGKESNQLDSSAFEEFAE